MLKQSCADGHTYTLGQVSLVVHGEDGEIYMDTQGAAEEFGVASCTVSNWKRRGLLNPIPESPPGKPIYRMVDVARAEKAARDRKPRRRGVNAG